MSYRVCIIDDDDIYQFTTQRSLRKIEAITEILPFSYSMDAIDYFKLHKSDSDKLPDFILLDINMPHMDGWEFLEEFKSFKDELVLKSKIFLITSSINPTDVQKSKLYPEIDKYIVKPVGLDIWTEIFSKSS